MTAASAERKLKVTVFPDVLAKIKGEHDLTWPELVAKLTDPRQFDTKADAPLLKLGTFGDRRTDKDSLRHDGNMLIITGIEGDYDGEQVHPDEAVDRLEKHGIRALVYTSPSHTDEKPRWRVLAPLSVDLPIHHREQMLQRLNGALGGILTSESFTLSQTYYYGRVNGHPYKCVVTFGDVEDGTCINELAELDAIAIGKPKVSATQTGEVPTDEDLRNAILGGENYHEALRSLSARFAGRGMSAEDIVATLTGLMNESKAPRDARFKKRMKEIPRLTAGAIGKYQRDGKPKEQVQAEHGTRHDPEIPSYIDEVPRQEGATEAPKGRIAIAIRRACEVAQKPQYAEWLLRPYLERNVLALMYGEFGTLKSFTALEFALTVSSGGPSRALPEAKVHGVYISAEGKGMWRRLKGWSIARGINLEDCKLWVIEHPVDLYSQQSLLELAEKINALGIEPVLIVVDTLSRNCGPADENKTADMTAFLNGLDKLLRVPFRCTVLLVHHVGHMAKDRARGAYVLQGNTDANYLIERPDQTRMVIELKTGRLKDSESPPAVCIEARVVELGTVDEDGRPETTLVLASSTERPKQARKAPTGKNQVRAYDAITGAIAAGQTLLQVEAVRLVQKVCEMPRQRAWEAVNGLLDGGFLVKGPMGPLQIPKVNP